MSKKALDTTTSFILANKEPDLIKFVLEEINKCTYFRTATLSKYYIRNVLGIKYNDIEGTTRKSTSIKIGRLASELQRLGILVKHSTSTRSVWKNLYKDELHETLDKKMEQNYFIIKMR